MRCTRLAARVMLQVGPSMKPDELKDLVQILNPDKIEGRLVLITRYGVANVASMLPAHIKAVAESGVSAHNCASLTIEGCIALPPLCKTLSSAKCPLQRALCTGGDRGFVAASLHDCTFVTARPPRLANHRQQYSRPLYVLV